MFAWVSLDVPLRFPQGSPKVPLRFPYGSPEVPLISLWGSPEVPPRFPWGSPGVPLWFPWGSPKVPLRFSWGFPDVLLRSLDSLVSYQKSCYTSIEKLILLTWKYLSKILIIYICITKWVYIPSILFWHIHKYESRRVPYYYSTRWFLSLFVLITS